MDLAELRKKLDNAGNGSLPVKTTARRAPTIKSDVPVVRAEKVPVPLDVADIRQRLTTVGPPAVKGFYQKEWRQWMADNEQYLPVATRHNSRRNRNTSCSEGYSPTDMVKYCLMAYLREIGYQVVLSEFKYMGSISDVFGVVKGRAVEFEIKASRTDFLADMKKKIWLGSKCFDKHGTLSNGVTMISRFYFVVPSGIATLRECPLHAGMIVYTFDGEVPVFKLLRAAPLLHEDSPGEPKRYLTSAEWQTIADRLQIRSNCLTDKYINNKFKKIIDNARTAPQH